MKERVVNITENKLAWLSAAFASSAHASSVVQHFKQQQLAAFLNRGFPSRREEAWKYTDTSFLEKTSFAWPSEAEETSAIQELVAARAADKMLLVFINGHFSPALSSQEPLPEGVIISNLQQALQTHASLIHAYLLREPDVQRHPFASLNAALFADGFFVYVPRNVILEKPLHILSIATETQPFMMQPRHLLVMEADTHATLIDEHVSLTAAPYFSNGVTDLFVGRNSLLNYYKIQNEGKNAKHFSTIFAHQKQHSFLNACSFAVGGQFARQDVVVYLQEKNASCCLKGFYGLGEDGQLCDHHIFIDHAAAHTQSEMDFRGVLAQQSRAVFNGKVVVRPGAKKAQAQQYNHNVLLSPLAEIDTKPDLEIYADDVQCRHGATVGQLDEEALFYLSTRGIDRAAATVMLLQAFMEAALSSVTLPVLAEMMQEQGAALWRNL